MIKNLGFVRPLSLCMLNGQIRLSVCYLCFYKKKMSLLKYAGVKLLQLKNKSRPIVLYTCYFGILVKKHLVLSALKSNALYLEFDCTIYHNRSVSTYFHLTGLVIYVLGKMFLRAKSMVNNSHLKP